MSEVIGKGLADKLSGRDFKKTDVDINLRDNFAGLAIQGMLSNPKYDGYTFEIKAEKSYKMADAMMKERDK